MKKAKFFKFKCLLVALVMAAMCATTAFAVPNDYVENVTGHIDHPGSENCIYSCVLDTFEAPAVQSEFAEVVDVGIHANCIYSCEHTDNPLVPITEEIPLMSEEEFKNFIAEVTGISIEDIHTLSSEDITLMSEEEMQKFVAEAIVSMDGFCPPHWYASGDCIEAHRSIGTCAVACTVNIICVLCGEISIQTNSHESHSWSVGWCGQTCTSCGKVDTPFHAPGGCWFCR